MRKWLIFGLFISPPLGAFEIDFSRRQQDLRELPIKANLGERSPATEKPTMNSTIRIVSQSSDVVLLNTDSGFVPSSLNLQMGQKYQFHVVNVNTKNKNSSFVMSAFHQSHATYFGDKVTFELVPDRKGIFRFECPETGIEGQLVVITRELRGLANE